MTIRFAAAFSNESTARTLTVTVRSAANDNALDFPRDTLLRAALKHFAEYGLGAAQQAHRNAEAAFFAGNRADYRHWLGICRALDRRMADAVVAHRGLA
ncbi:MAG: hypothetical protein JWQ16_1190 [Novosphingobium sp.]|jgi:hypothetical protein|nr:hypothetical protein [Novosphingobium sp.]